MKRALVVLLLALTVVNLAALGTMLVMRQRASQAAGCGQGTEQHFERVKRELGLTPVQARRFESIKAEFHDGMAPLDRRMEELRAEMLRQIWREHEQDIDSLLTEMSLLQMECQRLAIRRFQQMREVLTEKQWRRLHGIVAQQFLSRTRVTGFHQMPAEERDRP